MVSLGSPDKIMNKTTLVNQRKEKKPMRDIGFTPPPSKGVSELLRVVAAREHRSTNRVGGVSGANQHLTASKFDVSQVADSDKGLSKDLQDVVISEENKKSMRQSFNNQSPLLPPDRTKRQKILPKLNLQGNLTTNFKMLDSRKVEASPDLR